MYRTKEPTQKRKDEKRKMILATAAKVFSSNGYHNTTVKDIVNEAHISIGSFYFYFKSKEELFSELYISIAKEFDDITMSVIDAENYPMLKNFTRAMMAVLWMYEQKRDIARIMLLEAAAANPVFQMMEVERMKESAQIMTDWFERFNNNEVNIPDARVAALMYTSSHYCLVNDWLTTDTSVPLTQYGYAFCVYNLQALRIPVDATVVSAYIEEVLNELRTSSKNNL